MRGSPLLRAGFVFLALLLFIFPLRSLTNRRAPAPVAARPRAASMLHLTITSTTFPFHFSVSHLGHEIWTGESDGGSSAKDLALPFPPQGIDLLLQASWQEKKENAIRLEVAPNNGLPIARTLWGTESVSDVLTFQ